MKVDGMPEIPDPIVRGGRVYTLADDQPWTEAFAARRR
jgi:predicted amidohydrolase YtcJ